MRASFEGLLGEADCLMMQRSGSTPLTRSQSRPVQYHAQPPARRSCDSRRSLDRGQRCSVRVQAHSASIVQAAAVALAPQQAVDVDATYDLSWTEQRRLLEESYQAEAAPENVVPTRQASSSGRGQTAEVPVGIEEQAATSGRQASGSQESLSGAVPLRRARRGRPRDSERTGRGSRRVVPGRSASRAASLGRSAERSASRRRVLRRASSSAVAAVRADVRRIRQRRRIVVDPLAKTPEAADQRLLVRLGESLERRRRASKNDEDSASISGRRMGNAVSTFIESLGNTKVLSREVETQLALTVRKGALLERAVAAQQAELERQLTPGEIVELQGLRSEAHLALLRKNAETARALMLRFNTRLVINIAKGYRGRGVELQDLIQEGILGLLRAIDRFEPARGFKFSTYAHWWIRQGVTRCLSEQSRVVRLPAHVMDAVKRINEVRAQLDGRGGASGGASDEEVAAVLGLTPAKVQFYRRASMPIRSLDAPVGTAGSYKDEHEEVLGDTLDGEEVEGTGAEDMPPSRLAEALSACDVLQNDIDCVLFTLPARERNVIRMRYGLHRRDGRGMTLSDLSAAYGVTKERIRQLEESALLKLRRHQALLCAHLPVDAADAA